MTGSLSPESQGENKTLTSSALTPRSEFLRKNASIFFTLLVTVNCLWVLSLPLFPSQDGPAHLYYVSVIHRLVSGSKLFADYFSLRFPIPPYSVHYLLLFCLTSVTGYLVAEKLLVCFYLVVFCFGFRFLVAGVNPENRALAFCGIPLSLTWTLGMGFMNSCLAVAFSMVAIGCWLRFVKSSRPLTGAAYLGTVVLILFTHPVPLAVVLAFVWTELALRVFQSRSGSAAGMSATLWRQFAVASLSSCTLFYILLFINHRQSIQAGHHRLLQLGMIKDYLLLHPLVMTYGTFGAHCYRLCLYVLLFTAFAIALPGFRTRLRQRSLRAGDVLLFGAALLGVVYPFIPRGINGADFLPDRLALYIWLFAIAGAAIDFGRSRGRELLFVVGMTCVSFLTLAVNDAQFRPVAKTLMQMETSSIVPHGLTGIFIDAPIEPTNTLLNFSPYVWSAARYFRRADAIMLNAPWLDSPIVPIAPTKNLFTNMFAVRLVDYPDRFSGLLVQSQRVRDLISPKMNFILFVGYTDRDPRVVDNVLKQSWPHPWNCNRTGWYSVCSD